VAWWVEQSRGRRYSRRKSGPGVARTLIERRGEPHRRRDSDSLVKTQAKSEGQIRAGMVMDALIDAFVVVSDSSLKRRYEVMGALMAAQDALPDEIPAPASEAREERA
jgi:hypothetical protein